MKRYQDALVEILGGIQSRPLEEVELSHAWRRILAEDIVSHGDVPAFHRSAMDGYAVRSVDIQAASLDSPVRLTVTGEAPAGGAVDTTVTEGRAIQIMTGGAMPNGADTVIPHEETSENGLSVIILKSFRAGAHIFVKGEDVKQGETVLRKGAVLEAAELGMLSQLGRSEVEVYERPRVCIVTTGNELIPPGSMLTGNQIHESNSVMLSAQVYDCGAVPIIIGIARDEIKDLKDKLAKGLEEGDMLMVSGGVSVGKYDLVKDVLADLGVKADFWRVAIKPGKPLLYGHRGATVVFGLPGNPASSWVTCEIFVKPALWKMMGKTHVNHRVLHAKITHNISHKPDRLEFMRAKVEWGEGGYTASVVGPQGSTSIKSLTMANALLMVPEGVEKCEIGSRLEFIPLWYRS